MILRYSHHPIEDYSKVSANGIHFGPAGSKLLGSSPEAWNLAWLSHPYETRMDHPDPQFTVHVRRTTQYVLATGELDLAGSQPARYCIKGWLSLPAPKAVHLIATFPARHELPLFKAYGPDWLRMIYQRSWLCQPPASVEHDPLTDTELARQALARFRPGGS